MSDQNHSSGPDKKKTFPQNWDIDFTPLSQFVDRMDSLFQRSFKQFNGYVIQPFYVDTVETEEAMIVKAELPGYTRQQIELEIIGNLLKIVVEDRRSDEMHTESFSKKQSSVERKERTITIPFNIPKKETTATLEKGILTVTIPKKNANRHFLDIE